MSTWKIALAAVLFSSLSASLGCALPSDAGEDVESTADELRNLEREEAIFLDRINDYRASLGLPRLVSTRALTQAAFNHSADMASKNYFAHEGRDGSTFRTRMAREGYRCGYCGENLAAGSASAEGAFQQWKNSPGHDANMRNGRFRAIGIGRAYADSSTYKWYWTTVFGEAVDGSGDARETGGSAPPPPPPPRGCGLLGANGALGKGQSLASCNGQFVLVMQGDGNLVLYQNGAGARWHTSTYGRGGEVAVMQGDGNFVLYAGGGRPLWDTRTHGQPGAYLAVQDDGNLVVYAPGGRPLWARR